MAFLSPEATNISPSQTLHLKPLLGAFFQTKLKHTNLLYSAPLKRLRGFLQTLHSVKRMTLLEAIMV